jgi:predicted NBD/HSP70 family sugar kinase
MEKTQPPGTRDALERTKPGRAVGRPRTIDAAHASLAQLLTLIRTGRATTRLDLEHEAELGRAVIADRLAILAALGLVEEGDLGLPGRGRAPRHLRFRSDAGTLLVAALDRSSIAVGVADLTGRLLVEHHEAADLGAGPAAILDRLTTLLLWLMEDHGGKPAIWGLGLALPGPVGTSGEAGAPLPFETLEEWASLDLVSEMVLRFGAPAWVQSRTQMMTMGELRSGTGAPDMLYVNLGHTITAGVVSAGRLHRGAQGAAGMIGHAPTGEDGAVTCRCGSRGCLEAMAGGDAIARSGLAAAQDGRSRYLADALARSGEVTAADVGHGAQLGDSFCAELMVRCGRLVGESLAPLVNLLNPSLVILGGDVSPSGDILLAAIREAIYRQSHPLVTRDLRIVRSQLGGSAGLVGAAQVAADELFAADMLQGWITLGTPRRLPDLTAVVHAARSRSRATALAGPPAPR